MAGDPTTPDDLIALDTSASVPLLTSAHPAHLSVVAALGTRRAVLTGHSQAETYSVLTRLPGDARVAPGDLVELLSENFGDPVCLSVGATARVPARLSAFGVAGGAVYDAIVGLSAAEAGVPLLTRDARATSTYRSVGVAFELVAD